MDRTHGDDKYEEQLANLIDNVIFGDPNQALENVDHDELSTLLPVVQQLRELAQSSTDSQEVAREESSEQPLLIGKYQVTGLIGKGGQSAVFLAVDPDLERRVVLKLYYGERDADWDKTLMHEGRVLSRIQSPYIARCIAIERVADMPYLVLEYIPGTTLAQFIARRKVSVSESLELIVKIAVALAEVHSSGLTHGDLKPTNIVVGSDGNPRIVDFGLSPQGKPASGVVRGTKVYMAPELLSGETIQPDVRTDIYSLGGVLYELLTSEKPVQSTDAGATAVPNKPSEILPARRLNRRVPAWLSRICMKCLARRSDRYSSVPVFLSAIRASQIKRRVIHASWILMLIAATSIGWALYTTSRANIELPEPITLGEEWTISGWIQAPVTADHEYVALVGDGDDDFPLIAHVSAAGEPDSPIWLGSLNHRMTPHFQSSGFDLRKLRDGRYNVTAVGVRQSDGDPGLTKFFINGKLVGSIGSLVSSSAGSQIQNENVYALNSAPLVMMPKYPFAAFDKFRVFNSELTDAEVRDLPWLVAYWPFEESLRNTSLNSGKHHCVNSSSDAKYIEGQNGFRLALSLEPPTGAPQLELDNPVVLGSEFTISVWYKAPLFSSQTTESNPYIVLTNSTQRGNGDFQILGKWESNATVLRLGQRLNGGKFVDTGVDLIAAGGNTPGWHHIVCVGANGRTTFYLDRKPLRTIAGQSHSDVKYVGADPSPGGNRFANAIDEVRIFDRALSPTEVRDLNGLVAHWPFDTGLSDYSSFPGRQHLICNAVPVYDTGKNSDYRMSITLDPSSPPSLNPAIALGSNWTIAAWFFVGSQMPQGGKSPFHFLTRTSLNSPVESHIAILEMRYGIKLGYFTVEDRPTLHGRFLPMPAPGWHHVAAVAEAGSQIHYYLDGNFVVTVPRPTQSNVRFIGVDPAMRSRFSERIDDVRIFNYSLSAAEIRDLVGLVGYWPLDGNARDVSPAPVHHHGLEIGSYAPSAPGYGMALPLGGKQRLELAEPVDLGDQWTIAVRFQGLLNSGTNKVSMSLTKSSDAQVVDHQIIANWEAPGVVRLGMYVNGDGYTNIKDYDLAKHVTGGWHSIVAVGKDRQTKYFLDGVLCGVIPRKSTTDVKYIGAEKHGEGNQFAKMIDEVRIYDYALSDEVVKTLY